MSEPQAAATSAADVTCELADGIATLTLNRPQRFNTLTSEVIAALSEHLAALAASSEARVVILASTGKAFSTGHDLKEMNANRDENLKNAPSLLMAQSRKLVEQREKKGIRDEVKLANPTATLQKFMADPPKVEESDRPALLPPEPPTDLVVAPPQALVVPQRGTPTWTAWAGRPRPRGSRRRG